VFHFLIRRMTILPSVLLVPLVFLLLFLQAPLLIAGDLAVGDRVKFEFMGKNRKGTIVSFTGTDWPQVKFKYRGKDKIWLFPDDDVIRIGRTRSSKTKLATKMRIWSSRSGKSKIDAKLLSIDNEEVRLKKEDGKVITVAMSKLSDRDQGYVDAMRSVLAAATEEEDEEGLFDGGIAEDEESEESSKESDAFDPDNLPVGKSHSAEMVALRSKSSWPVQPDTFQGNLQRFENSVGVNRGALKESAFHDEIQCALNHDGTFAALGISNPFGKETSVRLIDLKEQKEIAQVLLLGKLELLALSDDGIKIATGKGNHEPVVEHVAIWEPVDGMLKPTGGWKRSGRSSSGPTAAQFLSKRQMIVSSGDVAALWAWQSGRAVTAYSIQSRTKPALSANRQQIALVGKSGNIYIVQANSGKLLTEIKSSDKNISNLTFSDDGTMLAGSSYGHLLVWNLKDGSQHAEAWLLRSPYHHDLLWAGNQFLLVGGRTLVDLRSGVAAWNYGRSKFIVKSSSNQFWTMHWENEGGSMIPFSLPPSSVVEACAEVDPDRLIWIEPGPISLVLEGLGEIEKEVRKVLTRKLTKEGRTIQSNADMVVKVWIEKSKTQTVNVRDFFYGVFGGEANEMISYTPCKGKYQVSFQGHVLSKATSKEFTIPRTLRMGTNESAQQAADRYCRPDTEFFKQVSVPRKGPLLPSGQESFGSSTLTRDGWR